jgi:SAM-dependent methyltransferase
MELLQQPKRAERPVCAQRRPWKGRLNAWRKRSPLNPYWIELRELHEAAKLLATHANGRLLDVGCGERPYDDLFLPRVTRYIGLEYPPVADNLNPEIWGKLHTIRHIVDVFGDGMKMPFADAQFDSVLALEMLEHVSHSDACVGEIARVLRPGGVFLLTVPFVAPLHQWPFDYLRYTSKGIEALLERHGLKIEKLEPRGNFASATGATVSHWLLRALGASGVNHDGSVTLSRWRAPFVLSLIALVQLFFSAAASLSNDKGSCLGYAVIARKRM